MSRTAAACTLFLAAASLGTVAHAQTRSASGVRLLIDGIEPGADGTVSVKLVAINPDDEAGATIPDRLPATLIVDGERHSVWLDCPGSKEE